MLGETRSQKPGLELGIEGSTRKKKVLKVSEVVEEVEVRVESWVNVKSSSRLLIEVEVETRLEEEATPFKSNGETTIETDLVREEIPVRLKMG